MIRIGLLVIATSVLGSNAFGADPPRTEAIQKKIADGKKEVAGMEKDLAKWNADTPAVVGEWVWAGELKVRVTGAELRDVMAMGIEGGPYKTGEKELAVKVEVASLSTTRRVEYSTFGSDPGMTDDRGNRYDPSAGQRAFGFGGLSNAHTQVLNKSLKPGDRPFVDVFFFQPPKAEAKELLVTLQGLQDGAKGEYRFRLTSWAVEPYPPAGTSAAIKVLEKAAQLTEDAGERDKLKDAAAVLRRASQGPPPIAEADRKREKRGEDLAAKIAAKRDEIRELEADLTAREFVLAGDWVQVGHVRVRVTGARVGKPVPVSEKGDKWQPDDTLLVVSVTVENRGKDKVRYRRWEPETADTAGLHDRPYAVLADLHGNRYGCGVVLGSGLLGYEGAVPHGSQEVEAGGSIEDLVCFEVPLKAAGELRLTLSGLQDGQKGSYRIKIPAAEWKVKK